MPLQVSWSAVRQVRSSIIVDTSYPLQAPCRGQEVRLPEVGPLKLRCGEAQRWSRSAGGTVPRAQAPCAVVRLAAAGIAQAADGRVGVSSAAPMMAR